MIKTIARLEYKVGERVYHFHCDADAPLGEIHDALTKFKTHVVDIIKTQDALKEAPKPEVKDEQ